MTDVKSEQKPSSGKGKAFFDRGDEVAETGNWDFAIQMYLEGVRREPGNVDRGHKPLREVSLKRKAQGGKPAGIMEKLKHASGKEPVDALINAEFLLAKDPGNIPHMVGVHKAGIKLNEPALILWISEILLEAMRQAKKPNRQICLMIANAFTQVESYHLAVAACDIAIRAFPNDGELLNMARNLSARDTIKQGQYDSEGGFEGSVLDMKKQMELAQRDHMAQDREFLEQDIARARTEYEEAPTVPGKIDAVVEALLKIEEEGYENEAIAVLEKGYRDTKAYRFKMRVDDVKIRQMRRRYNAFRDAGDKEKANQAARELLQFELTSYGERAAEYPTDHGIKFELGRRQLLAGQVDDAIVSLQQAKRDAKRRIQSLNLLGQAFHRKEWYQQAVENYEQALEFEPGEERTKDLRYNLATSLMAKGDKEKALEQLSDVAQLDYQYRDVRELIEKLRKELG